MSDAKFKENIRELSSLTDLEFGWDSYNAPTPSHLAVRNALIMLGMAYNYGQLPDHVGPDVNGGTAVSFFASGNDHDRHAWFSFDNDGGCYLVRSTRSTQEVLVTEIKDFQESL